MTKPVKLGKLQDIIDKRLTKEEQAEIDQEVALEIHALRTLQQNIKDALTRYMDNNEIGFNETSRRLGLTARQISQIQKGKANLKLSTIAHLSAMLGQTPMITFKKK